MPTLTKLISMKEASEHTSKDDCWVVIDGKVYDVTSYLEEHPGGEEALLEATAKDATDDFEDAGHSNEARELLEAFCIGELDESPPIIPELEVFSGKQLEGGCAEKLMDITKQYWVVPAAVIGLSMVVGFLYLHKK